MHKIPRDKFIEMFIKINLLRYSETCSIFNLFIQTIIDLQYTHNRYKVFNVVEGNYLLSSCSHDC